MIIPVFIRLNCQRLVIFLQRFVIAFQVKQRDTFHIGDVAELVLAPFFLLCFAFRQLPDKFAPDSGVLQTSLIIA